MLRAGVLGLLMLGLAVVANAAEPPADSAEFFEAKIRPLFRRTLRRMPRRNLRRRAG